MMKKNQNNYLQKKRLEVLKFAKIFVSKKGLSKNTLESISKKYGLDANETELLFPEGNIDFIKFTLDQLNNELEEYCRKIDLIRLPVHKRIKKVLLSKIFLMNNPLVTSLLDNDFYKFTMQQIVFHYFKNKKILITGATGGIGGALVKKFVSLGGTVLGTGTKADKLDLIKKNHPTVKTKKFNISEHLAIEEFIDSASEELGGLDVLVNNLIYAVDQLAQNKTKVLIEACNTYDRPGFLINTSAQALDVIRTVNHKYLALQYDLYHMQIMEGNLVNRMKEIIQYIGHIQFADTPGRHEPGSGEINYPYIFEALDTLGWEGWLGAEYIPSKPTIETLEWLKPYL